MVSPLRTTGENIFRIVLTITSGEWSRCPVVLNLRMNTYLKLRSNGEFQKVKYKNVFQKQAIEHKL